MKYTKVFNLCSFILFSMLSTEPVSARTKLVTLPDRDITVISIEKKGYTLIYEEREIPLQSGTNFIDFSWNGVSIDKESVFLEYLDNPGTSDRSTKTIATGFPPNENALTWQVYSPEPRTERIRVSYLIYGISTENSYELMANEAETSGLFRSYLMIQNNSGEDFEETQLIYPGMGSGIRDIDSGETRRILIDSKENYPIEKVFVAQPRYEQFRGEDMESIGLKYRILNNPELMSAPGTFPPGKIRLFGEDGMGSSIFLGEDMLPKLPSNEDHDLSLGEVKDVVLKRYLLKAERQNIRRNDDRKIVLFDEVRTIRYEIENFKTEEVTLFVEEPLNGEWELTSVDGQNVKTERESNQMLRIEIRLPEATNSDKVEKKIIDLEIVFRNRFPREKSQFVN